jgi:YrbI family 3-deoxy-D-manno-octulosonate 8-phosphate phosphatase
LNFKKIKAVVFDFDGVFTNNQVIVSEDGKESVQCNRADGIGLEVLRRLDIPMTIISTEKNPVVAMRAKKLKLTVVHGVENKLKELIKFSASNKIDLNNIAYVGNDINDIDCMKKIGFPIAVADAFDDIKTSAKYILNKNGGDGAVRELCELIFNSYQNA